MELTSIIPPSDDRRELTQRFKLDHGLTDLSDDDLDWALTHSSHAFEKGLPSDNERLEFLGDSVLGVIVSEELYRRFEKGDEGELSKRRAQLVSRTTLGRRAAELGLGPLLLLGVGEERSGGARRRSVLGCALEALVGVIYLRSGFERAKAFCLPHILNPLLDGAVEAHETGDAKSELQEWSQRERGCLPVYETLEESGPDHDKRFQIVVSIGGEILGRGTGTRIKSAQSEAARQALESIKNKQG